MSPKEMDDDLYGLLFSIRRSIRYHDRRRAFFERMHRVTGALTILLAGSVIFEAAGESSPFWLQLIGVGAAVLAAFDMVVGYAKHASQHEDLKCRFIDLERDMLSCDSDTCQIGKFQATRLEIERDEPPVYRALDLLCHNELMAAEGSKEPPFKVSKFEAFTSHILHWPNIASRQNA
jgi:hypothetical protein